MVSFAESLAYVLAAVSLFIYSVILLPHTIPSRHSKSEEFKESAGVSPVKALVARHKGVFHELPQLDQGKERVNDLKR